MERLYMFTKHHDFCESRLGDETIPKWPPLSSRQIFIGEKNMGCDEVCAKQGIYMIFMFILFCEYLINESNNNCITIIANKHIQVFKFSRTKIFFCVPLFMQHYHFHHF